MLPEQHEHVLVVGVVGDDDVKLRSTKLDEDFVEGGWGELGHLAAPNLHQMLVDKLKNKRYLFS